jgi:aspartyl-tRNA(Asn)/glutamyl-tRNA(Gln) amidotransferase subunit A
METIYKKPAHELAKLIQAKELSPTQLMAATLERIDAVNPQLNAFVALRPDEAMAEARAVEKRLAEGKTLGPLAGIPIGVKDLEDVQGMATTFGSIPYAQNLAKQDSVQVSRLKAAGAIVVGKTNTPEFGFTGFTKNRLFGVTKNPWDTTRTPGGSSGGSAAAVASGMVPLATGSDAGGSIRIPSAYSGCFGFKPTYGRIPFGPVDRLLMTRTWNMGPIARTVGDAALHLDCTAGYHPTDPQSLPKPEGSFVTALSQLETGLKIGFTPDLGYARVERDILKLVKAATRVFSDLGHHLEDWEGRLPDVTEAWSRLTNLEVYGQVHDDLEDIRPELNRTLAGAMDLAKEMSCDELLESQKIQSEFNRAMEAYFDQYDLLLTPTVPTEAFGAKGPPPTEIDGEVVPILWAVAFTYPFNVSGHPAATIMAGLTPAGLPAGLQIIGPRHQDERVLKAAYAFEQATSWVDQWPPI